MRNQASFSCLITINLKGYVSFEIYFVRFALYLKDYYVLNAFHVAYFPRRFASPGQAFAKQVKLHNMLLCKSSIHERMVALQLLTH